MPKYWTKWTVLFFLIVFLFSFPLLSQAKKTEILFSSPVTGEFLHGFQLIRANIKGTLSPKIQYYLSIIDVKGNKNNISLTSSQHHCFTNIDTRAFSDGTYYLYIWALHDQTIIVDSEVITVLVDNRTNNLDVQIHPTLSRSGSEIEFLLKASIMVQRAFVELDNGVRIYLSQQSESDLWTGRYFIPYLWNEGTHFISFEAEDSSGKKLTTSSSFIICNSEPFIVFPKDGMQIMKRVITVKGQYAAGKSVYLALNEQYIGEVFASYDGEWIFPDLNLSDKMNTIRVYSEKENMFNPLFPYQEITLSLMENSLIVLTYHNIAPNGNIYSRSTEDFENDLRYLLENGFNPVAPALLASYFDGKASLPDNPVLLCFDDGYTGVYTEAYPLLKQYQLSALFFILTSRVGVFRDFVSWEQLSEMQSARVFSIESHTHNSHFYVSESEGLHAALTSRIPLPDGTLESHQAYRLRVRDDLSKSKQLIENNINKEVLFLSVPFGAANKEVNEIALELGYKATFNSDGGMNELPLKPLNIRRNTVKRDDRIEDIVY